jgi:predicted aminopeptidase
VLVLAAVLGSCGTAYYLQAAAGQAALLRAREPLEQVLADPATPTPLRRQLLVVDDALLFARLELGLPATKSYHHYADLERTAVVWNVFAAPEYSLEPRAWCYPVAGCATYRGWFSEQKAREFAASLAARGDDVFVGGVAAYSTLGWFADPILSTMLGGSDAEIAGLLYHELAHQLVYVAGDTAFSEGFATFIEEEGTRRWLVSRNDARGLREFKLRRSRRAVVLALVEELRDVLGGIYAADIPAAERRRQRAGAFADAHARYNVIRASWSEPPWFDGWLAPEPNNARLAALSSYEAYVPAFRALLAREDGKLARFYESVISLGRLSRSSRDAAMQALSESAAAGSGCRGGC